VNWVCEGGNLARIDSVATLLLQYQRVSYFILSVIYVYIYNKTVTVNHVQLYAF
jgi:hypothetical protein